MLVVPETHVEMSQCQGCLGYHPLLLGTRLLHFDSMMIRVASQKGREYGVSSTDLDEKNTIVAFCSIYDA